MDKIIRQEFSVSFSYPVVFTSGLFNLENSALRDVLSGGGLGGDSCRWVAFIDEGVMAAHPDLVVRMKAYISHQLPLLEMSALPQVIPGGESVKSDRPAIDRMIRVMAEARIDRHSFVLAIGGGAVLDAAGYAASLVHRGVRLIRIPTTVLAQNDSGVGVKTAINDPAGKNFLGTFAPPYAVINDRQFLPTLPDEHWRGGIAEAFKVALLKDEAFFAWLCEHAAPLCARDAGAMDELVYRCAGLHLHHIRSNGDPFELGRARPLDFGHWSAHQLERMSGYAVNHGAAVAIGIMLDSLYAVRSGWLGASVAHALHDGLARSGFALWHPLLDRRDAAGRLIVFEGIDRFREHLGGTLCITMPCGPGRSREISAIDEKRMESCMVELREKSAVHSR